MTDHEGDEENAGADVSIRCPRNGGPQRNEPPGRRPVVLACASSVAAPPAISGRWCNATSASAMASSSKSVARSGRLDMNAPAGAHVTPENVKAYVAELNGRVSSVTVYGSIQKLRRFTQLIAPQHDVGWLIELERQLYSERRPRPKWHRVVTTDVLVDAGQTLMAEAELAKRPMLTRARMFRNGLMVALLAYCPIRLKNFAALEIGRSFVNVDGNGGLSSRRPRRRKRGQTSGQSPRSLQIQSIATSRFTDPF